MDDIPPKTNELFGAYVLTKVANCDINNVDVTQALVKPINIQYMFLVHFIADD